MEYGGITPLGLPAEWRVLVDARVLDIEVAIIGSGVRRSKLLLPGPAARPSCPAPRWSRTWRLAGWHRPGTVRTVPWTQRDEAGSEPDDGRDETREERLDRKWGDMLQELRVMQTGAQLTAGFLLTLPFQPKFPGLDASSGAVPGAGGGGRPDHRGRDHPGGDPPSALRRARQGAAGRPRTWRCGAS